MRRGLLSLAGIALSIPVLYGAARSTYTIEVAAVRLVVLAVAVSIIDRYVAPVMVALFKNLAPGNDASARQ